jgi:hypothetical protein
MLRLRPLAHLHVGLLADYQILYISGALENSEEVSLTRKRMAVLHNLFSQWAIFCFCNVPGLLICHVGHSTIFLKTKFFMSYRFYTLGMKSVSVMWKN